MTIVYLSGAVTRGFASVARKHGIGILVQPMSHYHREVGRYHAWAADNGAFSEVGAFNPIKFRALLARPELQTHLATCLFVAAPDVLRVRGKLVYGDAVATLAQFPQWATEIKGLGYPCALVAQNGLERMLDRVPWDLVDAMFIGGSTEWKLSRGARICVDAAKARGKHTHMGRVNSFKRLARAQAWGVDSADGTFLKFGPDKNLPRLLQWLRGTERNSRQLQIGGV